MSLKHKFVNFPSQRTLLDYSRVKKQILQEYSKTPGLVSLYEWGSVSQPGISDMDLVLVFNKKKIKSLPYKKRSFFLQSDYVKYIVFHPFMYVDGRSFADLQFIYPGAKLQHLTGEKIGLKKLTKEQKLSATISVMNDLIIRHYPRDFLTNQIDVRSELLRLNSLTYSMKTMEQLTRKKKSDWVRFSKDVKELRRKWFDVPDTKKLESLHLQATKFTIEIIDSFSNYLKDKNKVTLHSNQSIVYTGIKNKTKFIFDWDARKYAKVISAGKNNNYSSLPLILAPQLSIYAERSGFISAYIKKHLKGEISYDCSYKLMAQKRIGILNNQAALSHMLKHSDFPAFFDFGYRTGTGINNKIVRLLDALKY